MAMQSLDRLRLHGLRILLLASLIWTVLIGMGGMLMGNERAAPALLLSALANILPTWMVMRRRNDLEVRLVMGTLAALQPAITLFLLSGHVWQMDAHMYFFVALAALTVLYDWRPILLAAALIAVHHLVLTYVAPNWVFSGQAEIGRVIVHGVAVVLQGTILAYLSIKLQALLLGQDAHVADVARLAREAEAGRGVAESAMDAQRQADARESQLRTERELEKGRMMRERRAETLALVGAFRQSVAGIVGAVSAATTELEESAVLLNDLARNASLGTGETMAAAGQSSASAAVLARRIEQLSESISAIAAAAGQQASLGGEAQRVSAAGHEAVQQLEGRTSSITSFADSITEIAARTNLLALNATIEAARAGDVGRGFAVVAGEVKQLANQTASATGEIQSLAWAARQGAGVAQEALSEVAGSVEELARAAHAIQLAVADQRDATAAIGQSARDTARDANHMAEKMANVADVARSTENLSGRVSSAATGLSRTAQELQRATDLFVAQLEAA
ncbi:methyl-accepting chemotaxis protein [Sphingobium sp. AP49]|uniref:methyl-accepting chemotaxis protein n=1 Tax=Sphingobium sp. AP49 TaxID=1144307 RepID=UPI00026EE3B0|nr:methyl-accepting chemotaxis protein [Sphingobium sp. AP49]WHO40011.1 methyl-accepting chemotaxis protein [Sphingobium sp. AP49]